MRFILANRPLKNFHLDSGTTHAIIDALNHAVVSYDSKGAYSLSGYDVINRPVYQWTKDNSTQTDFVLSQASQYGDSAGLTDPQDENLIGKIYRHYDEAGRMEVSAYDFKGNPLTSTRRVILASKLMSVFAGPPTGWDVKPYRVDWTGFPSSIPAILDSFDYTSDNAYDALNRITLLTYPAARGDSNKRRIMIPVYDKSGKLESVNMQDDFSALVVPYVQRIVYNARGQKLMLALNTSGMDNNAGMMTRFVYNEKSFRTSRMKTEAYALTTTSTTDTYTPQSGTTRQDFAYTYDALGNIKSINDKTPNGGVAGATGLTRNFDYDALYRLLKATGRENGPTTSDPYLDNIRSDVASSTRAYNQYYAYDKMGNIEELNHDTSGGGSFTRAFGYSNISDNNLMDTIIIGSTNYPFAYDATGNQTLQDTTRNMKWDYANKLKAFYIQAGTSEPTKYAQYLYGADGQRVMKLIRHAGGSYRVRIYIGGMFEEYYEVDAGGTNLGYQNEVMVMDGSSRIASERLGTAYGDATAVIKYIFSDNIGSSNVLIDNSGGFVSAEEYYPFGETSFGSYAKKRYRFCGKERDRESSMYYYGARYYVAWTCRFVSVDPKASKYAYQSSYVYADNNPVMVHDINGEGKDEPSAGKKVATNGTQSQSPYANYQPQEAYHSVTDHSGPNMLNTDQQSNLKPVTNLKVTPVNKSTQLHPADNNKNNTSHANQIRTVSEQSYVNFGGIKLHLSTQQVIFAEGIQYPLAQPSFTQDKFNYTQTQEQRETYMQFVSNTKALNEYRNSGQGMIINGVYIGLTSEMMGLGMAKAGNALFKVASSTMKIGGVVSEPFVTLKTVAPIGGRLGNTATRTQIYNIVTELESRSYDIIGGGGRDSEEYLRPFNGGRTGGSYIDITAIHPDYGTLRINTVDVYKNGLPTNRELINATRIRQQINPGEHLLLIPKR